MTALWTENMSAGGATASVNQLTVAWADWATGNLLTHTELERALQRAGVPGSANRWCHHYDLATKMLRKARAAGVIRFAMGSWHFVGEGQPIPPKPEAAVDAVTRYVRMCAETYAHPDVRVIWSDRATTISALSLTLEVAAGLARKLGGEQEVDVLHLIRAIFRASPDDHETNADLWDGIEEIAGGAATRKERE